MNRTRQLLLGVFFLATLGVLASYTLFWTDTLSFFGEPILIRARFPEANGLRKGDPVLAAGVRMGRVRELEYDIAAPRSERVSVVLDMEAELELSEGARIIIQESTLLGGRQVLIEPGEPGGRPLSIDVPFRGEVEKNPIEALEGIGQLVEENRVGFKSIVDNLDAVVTDVRAGKGLLARLLIDESTNEEWDRLIDDLSKTAARLEAGEGVLGALIQDDALAEDVRSIVGRLDTVATDLAEGQGLLARLIYDESMATELETTLTGLREIVQGVEEGEGVIGELLTDRELGERFDRIVTNLDDASNDIAEVATHLRSGEGTMGRLLMDQELYDELRVTLGLLTRSLEDYREAAPVTAFTSVLFSGF